MTSVVGTCLLFANTPRPACRLALPRPLPLLHPTGDHGLFC